MSWPLLGGGRRLREVQLVSVRHAAPEKVEGHYLQFDGLTTHAVADAAFGAVVGDYTFAIKVSRPMIDGGSAGGGGSYVAVGGPSTYGAGVQARYGNIVRFGASGTTSYFEAIRPDTGAVLYSFSAGTSASAGPKVLASKRTVGGQARHRVIDDTGVEYSNNRAASWHKPDHLAIGAGVDNTLTAWGQRGPVSFVSAILAAAEVSDAELQAWLADDQRGATPHVASLVGYWVASDFDGAVIPPRVGSSTMSCVGLDLFDLVKL